MRVAVLGAGVMGASLALLLARRGIRVSLFDAAAAPFSGASRWNEGKIHLGFLYSADPSLQTARHIIPGGLQFRPLVEDLLSCSLEHATTREDDIFVCHTDSVVGPDVMQGYFERVAEIVGQHPDARRYLADVADCRSRTLTPDELGEITGSPEILAGYVIPERSVATTWVADRYVGALDAEPRIEWRMNHRVHSVRSASGTDDGPWQIGTDQGEDGPYDLVINALWQGRLAVDRTLGLMPEGVWSNRFRLAVFLRTAGKLEVPSTLIATGPFGDVKNYNGRDFYLSWYPKGLRVDSSEILPPEPPLLEPEEKSAFCRSVLDSLESLLPRVAAIRQSAEAMQLEGGWVFAAGQGALSNPRSTLHRRSEFGVFRRGSYLSVDTGKYSTAPWMAHRIVETLARA